MTVENSTTVQTALNRALTTGAATAAGRWRLDPDRSSVTLRVRSGWGLTTVRGVFRTLAGNGLVTPDGLVTGTLTLRAASIDTGNTLRDSRLRSAKFLNTAEHSDLTVAVTEAVRIGNGRLHLSGNLTVAGTGRPIDVAAEVVALDSDGTQLRADLDVSRAAFGLTRYQLGMVSDRIRAHVEARFIRVAI